MLLFSIMFGLHKFLFPYNIDNNLILIIKLLIYIEFLYKFCTTTRVKEREREGISAQNKTYVYYIQKYEKFALASNQMIVNKKVYSHIMTMWKLIEAKHEHLFKAI